MVKPLKVTLLLAAIGSVIYNHKKNGQNTRQSAIKIIRQHQRQSIVDYSQTKDMSKVPVATSSKDFAKDQRPFYSHMYDNNPELYDQLEKAMKKYNFGSCGPRGFLGTYTSHLLLERDLSFYYGQSTILFPSAASVMESILLTVNTDGILCFEDDNTAFRLPEAFSVMKINYKDFVSGTIENPDLSTLLDFTSRGGGNKGGVNLWLVYDADDERYDHGSILQACSRYGVRTCVKHNFLQPPEGFWRAYSTRTGIQLTPSSFDLIITSLEQALGCPGGIASGSLIYIGNARTTAPGYVYSASQPPALCHITRVLIRQIINSHLSGELMGKMQESDTESTKNSIINQDKQESEDKTQNNSEQSESNENQQYVDVKQVLDRDNITSPIIQ